MALDSTIVQRIRERLATNQPLRCQVPGGGVLNVDRQLPFLCVFRRPRNEIDASMAKLVRGEGAYLVGRGDRSGRRNTRELVQLTVAELAPHFGAFLIVELWAAAEASADMAPHFTLAAPARTPQAMLETLQAELGRMRVQRRRARVTVERLPPVAPGFSLLLTPAQAQAHNVFVIGIEVAPIFRDPTTGTVFPLVLRRLHRGLSLALRRCFYEFAVSATTHRPDHFHTLGRRAMVKAVWDADAALARIDQTVDFLLLVTPTNAEAAWRRFRRDHFAKAPAFRYRSLPFDPAKLKRSLFAIPIERVEDPMLARLFGDERQDLERRLSMLVDRNTPSFLYGSLQVYGPVDDALLDLARDILQRLPPHRSGSDIRGTVGAAKFAEAARAEIARCTARCPQFRARVEIRADLTGLMVSRDCLYVGASLQVSARRVEALIQHEIGVHIATYCNGADQPFAQLRHGLTGYEELQEGLAVFAEYLVGGFTGPRLRLLAARVVAARMVTEGSDFLSIFHALRDEGQFDSRTAYLVTMRVTRGGGFTKDAVYLRGLVSLLKHLADGGEIEPLYVGKIAEQHMAFVRELQWRRVLRSPLFIPSYLTDEAGRERLAAARTGLHVCDLVGIRPNLTRTTIRKAPPS